MLHIDAWLSNNRGWRISPESLSIDGHVFLMIWLQIAIKPITKTRLFKYTENFTTKKWRFSDKKFWYFSYFCSKHTLWLLVRTASSIYVLSRNKENNIYHCKPKFYYIKMGLRGSKLYRYVFVMPFLCIVTVVVIICVSPWCIIDEVEDPFAVKTSRKHANIILTSLNPTFI